MRETAANVPSPDASTNQTKRQTMTRTPLSRHVRKCRICNHPDRAAIEFDFINWRNPADLVKSFQLRDLSTVYRHAHATGLLARRRLNLRGLMERIAERVSEVPITGATIIRAARAIAHINDAGEWVDPPTRIVVTHEHVHCSEPARRGGRKMGPPRLTASRAWGISPVKIKKASPAIFTSENLDEPSPDAAAAGEKPKSTDGPKEIVLALEPELQKLRIERWEAIQADRQANAAKNSAFVEQMKRDSDERMGSDGGPLGTARMGKPRVSRKGTASAVPSTPASATSLLPQAASSSSAPSALSVHEPRETAHGSRPFDSEEE